MREFSFILDPLTLRQLAVLHHEAVLVLVRDGLAVLVSIHVLVGQGLALLHLLPLVPLVEIFAVVGDVLNL